ncbi:MAG: class IV adenylate cyclase [Candidatus Microsaccharimonas sp.]
MKTEIEVKFLNVDFDQVRATLTELGAVCEQPMRLMRRVLSQQHERTEKDNHSAFLRLRDEGDKVTLTFKEFRERSLTGASEREVVVSDFDETLAILKAAGIVFKTFQESKRETWSLNDVEIVLDEWPWLNPYIEIEGDSEEAVKAIAHQMGYSWDDAVFGATNAAYMAQYPDGRNSRDLIGLPEIKFGAPLPDIFKPLKELE